MAAWSPGTERASGPYPAADAYDALSPSYDQPNKKKDALAEVSTFKALFYFYSCLFQLRRGASTSLSPLKSSLLEAEGVATLLLAPSTMAEKALAPLFQSVPRRRTLVMTWHRDPAELDVTCPLPNPSLSQMPTTTMFPVRLPSLRLDYQSDQSR